MRYSYRTSGIKELKLFKKYFNLLSNKNKNYNYFQFNINLYVRIFLILVFTNNIYCNATNQLGQYNIKLNDDINQLKQLVNSDNNLKNLDNNKEYSTDEVTKLRQYFSNSESNSNGAKNYFINKHEIDSKRKFRSADEKPIHGFQLNNATNTGPTNLSMELQIFGFRLETEEAGSVEYDESGIPNVHSDKEYRIRVFGMGITNNTIISFTSEKNALGGSCLVTTTKLFRIIQGTNTGYSGAFYVMLPKSDSKQFYMCAKNDENIKQLNADLIKPLVHQGSNYLLIIRAHEDLIPTWVACLIVVTCLCFSALFSGLNLGLMALDRTELKILRDTGTTKERKYAAVIQPVRDRGNFLLCSILLGNVLVNSTFTILLDSLTSGLIAIIFSTLLIVIFGEITPQAICSRHGLAVGAKTIYITKAVMIITFPLSYPISKLLDKILGEEIGATYNRERLKALVKVTTGHNDLDHDEVNIIEGALELRMKTVADVMTQIDDVFMLSLDAILDFETVSEIMKSGFSRIPVFDGNRRNVVTLLFIKDLAFVDPDDNTPLKTLCEFYQNACYFVFEDLTLDVMFSQFKEGTVGHMAFVHRVNNEGDGDPFYETIGLVTLEDVIEEIIKSEIHDETDVFLVSGKTAKKTKKDFTMFASRDAQKTRISPQLMLATFQFLSTTIEPFKTTHISETILRRLLNQDIIQIIKCKGKDRLDPALEIFKQGKPVDFFVLILEGRVEVKVGRENLIFESGPFSYFGVQALGVSTGLEKSQSLIGTSLQSLNVDTAQIRHHTFTPDYSVRAITDITYLLVKRSLYLAAKRATLLERSQKSIDLSDSIDEEVEKLLHSLNDDDPIFRTGLGNYAPRFRNNRSPSPSPSIINIEKSIIIEDRENDKEQKNFDNDDPSHTNSLQTSFNQNSASILGSKQNSNNSMNIVPNLSSPSEQMSPNEFVAVEIGSGDQVKTICSSIKSNDNRKNDNDSLEDANTPLLLRQNVKEENKQSFSSKLP